MPDEDQRVATYRHIHQVQKLWSLHKSILWAILHGICSWLYVIYYAIVR